MGLQEILQAMPQWYITTFVLLFGLMVGSFLNVCIYRMPLDDQTVFFPLNSHCTQCNYQLRWFDNVPVLSWVLLRGKCRQCKTPISFQYPMVEILTAVFALAIVKKYQFSMASIYLFVIIAGLIVATFIDLQHWIIPDEISLGGTVVGLLGIYFFPHSLLPTIQSSLLGALIGSGTLFSIAMFYKWILKKEGLGFGDVKLLALLGVLVGWEGIPFVILFSSLQGTLVTLLLLALGWKSEPPYEVWEETISEKEHIEENETTEEEATSESNDLVTSLSSEQSTVYSREMDATSQPSRLGQVAIPFGPFLVLGAIEVLFWGKALMKWLTT